jgi:hypothetical protein
LEESTHSIAWDPTKKLNIGENRKLFDLPRGKGNVTGKLQVYVLVRKLPHGVEKIRHTFSEPYLACEQ